LTASTSKSRHDSTGWYELYIDWSPDEGIDGIDVEIPASLSGSIDAIGQSDIYSFYVYEESLVTFDVDAAQYGSDLDAVLELYDEYWNGLDYNDDTDGSDPYLEVYLWPGLYYVEVRGYFGESVGGYEFYIDCSESSGPGGGEDVEMSIEIPGMVSREIRQLNDNHIYWFYVYEESLVSIEVVTANYGSNLDAVLELWDEYGIQLGYNDDTYGYDPYLEVYMSPGLYYVIVRACAYESTGWYELWIVSLE